MDNIISYVDKDNPTQLPTEVINLLEKESILDV
jgi:hypothetical protein